MAGVSDDGHVRQRNDESDKEVKHTLTTAVKSFPAKRIHPMITRGVLVTMFEAAMESVGFETGEMKEGKKTAGI